MSFNTDDVTMGVTNNKVTGMYKTTAPLKIDNA